MESLFDLPLRCTNTHTHTHLLNTRHLLSKVRLNIKNFAYEYETKQEFTNKNIKVNKQCKESIKIRSMYRNQIKRKIRKIAQISMLKANRSVFANSLTEHHTYRVQTLYSKFWVPLILKCPVDIWMPTVDR